MTPIDEASVGLPLQQQRRLRQDVYAKCACILEVICSTNWRKLTRFLVRVLKECARGPHVYTRRTCTDIAQMRTQHTDADIAHIHTRLKCTEIAHVHRYCAHQQNPQIHGYAEHAHTTHMHGRCAHAHMYGHSELTHAHRHATYLV